MPYHGLRWIGSWVGGRLLDFHLFGCLLAQRPLLVRLLLLMPQFSLVLSFA